MKKTAEEELLKEWQERLGLQDWRIKLNVNCTQDDMELEDVAGENAWNETIKTSFINIISKKEYGDRILEFDFEKTLVHELLHLKFSLLDNSRFNDSSCTTDRYVHQLIDDVARSLVCAKRNTRDEKQ